MSDAAAVDTGSESSQMPDLSNSGEVQPTSRDDVQAAIDAVMNGESDDGQSNKSKEVQRGENDDSRNDQGNKRDVQTEDNRPADKPKSSAWASLHKQKVEFQAQRDAFAKEKAEVDKVKSLLENAKTDRLSALEALGYTDIKEFIDGLVEDGGRMTPERKKVLELERKLHEREQKEKEYHDNQQREIASKQQQAQLDRIHNEVVQKINADYADSLVSIEGGSQEVMQEMDRLAGENGVMPDISEAVANVQKRYEENFQKILGNPRAQQIALDIFKSNKIPLSPSKPATRTISSNAVSGTSLPKLEEKRYSLDDDLERMVSWVKTQK